MSIVQAENTVEVYSMNYSIRTICVNPSHLPPKIEYYEAALTFVYFS